MIVQQKMMTPPPADEQQAMQQKMMKYMMVFFGLMFYKVAAGLCLYFIASSVWGFCERKLLPKKKPVVGEISSDGYFQKMLRRAQRRTGDGRGSVRGHDRSRRGQRRHHAGADGAAGRAANEDATNVVRLKRLDRKPATTRIRHWVDCANDFVIGGPRFSRRPRRRIAVEIAV